jgi:hypothetical protein
MSVEIHFGAGPNVTKPSLVRGDVKGLGVNRSATKAVQAGMHTLGLVTGRVRCHPGPLIWSRFSGLD